MYVREKLGLTQTQVPLAHLTLGFRSEVVVDEDLNASVLQSSGYVFTLVDEGGLAYYKDGSEVRVGFHFSQAVSINQALFVDAEGAVPFLQQGIESIEYTGVTKVRVLKGNPFANFNSADENRVNPFKATGTLLRLM